MAKAEQTDTTIMSADAASIAGTTVSHTPTEEDAGTVDAEKWADDSESDDAASAPSPSPEQAKTTTAESVSDESDDDEDGSEDYSDFYSDLGSDTRNGAEQHFIYWYRDGDTVVRVEDTLYKLHSSRLIELSAYFKELLGGGGKMELDPDDSDPDDPNWMPSVHYITETTARDFDALLAVDRRPTDFILTPPPFHTVAAIIRAASALGFKGYYDLAIQRLNKLWDSRLEDVLQESLSEAAAAVALARECDIPQVPRRALYELLRMDEGKLYANDHRGLDELESADQQRVIKAREALAVAWVKNATQFPPPSRCLVDKSGCAVYRSSSWRKLVVDSGILLKYMHDPIAGLLVLIEQDWAAAGWCVDCVEKMKREWGAERERIWKDLDLVWK
ncbi:hypothetical protein BV22DRAFT_1198321 [Leucogyrophana mollusca]|uniref:Uncharacterized protein n=1 Tax=Leucogyrophana mollusca TaxID=85980 RepID=A0ACB8B7R8_9AGAM|nr:hypothetical protein BV22DRAFT_1198321 [Leucogyrophana mollusca]